MININEMATFCKKKGFVYPSSEIYGGIAGFFDYGPLGVELKENVKKEWWKTFVQSRKDVAGIDGAIITNPKVWKASGHIDSFVDFLLACKKCKKSYRADHLIESLGIKIRIVTLDEIRVLVKKHKIKCPECKNELSEVKEFNLMFKTSVGPLQKEITYLRPETAQLIFTNFKLVMETSRLKLPFGIAQIGKAFRNEISPRDFLFRSREFEQMEIEFFVHPEKYNDCNFLKEVFNLKVNMLTANAQEEGKKEAKETTVKEIVNKKLISQWHAYWLSISYKWFLDLGVMKNNLRLREHLKGELAHYAGACFDIEYKFPFGWQEIHGNADRKQFDLTQHNKFSKNDLSVYDEETRKKVIPYVAAEPSQGVDRAFLAFMFDAYSYDEKRGNIVLRLNPRIAPIKAAVFPLLSNKKELVEKAKTVYDELKKELNCSFDLSGSIGKKYARADEIGIPYCITVDFESLKNNDATIRSRDTTKQKRIKINDLKDILIELINNKISFEKL